MSSYMVCPLCGARVPCADVQRPRRIFMAHVYVRHQALGLRERSLLADRAAAALSQD